MLNNREYFNQSIVNHIYFLGAIKSFCTTIGLTFFKNNQDYIDRSIDIGKKALRLLNQALLYADKDIANEVLNNGAYITKYTKDLSILTEKLFDINLQSQIDQDRQILTTREKVNYDNVLNNIDSLNNESLVLINEFKDFCKEIKDKLDNQELFSYLYPDFYEYMYEEIAVYGRDIERIISRKDYTDFYLSEYNYYFNGLMEQSAKYIRGFLDTIHQDVFDMASFYADSFAKLKMMYQVNKNANLTNEIERLIINYKNFVSNIIERLLNTELYFIIPPITLDNFLTNINVYLFILNYSKNF